MEVIAEEEEVLIANPAVIPQNAMLVTSALKKYKRGETEISLTNQSTTSPSHQILILYS